MSIAVSVIVPAYNAEKTVGKTLDSLLGQTLKNIEILVVDDGSKDATRQVISQYVQKDSRVRLLPKDINEGLSAARNTGAAQAQGAYIGFVDSDDWCEPDMFEKMYQASAKADVVVSGFFHDSFCLAFAFCHATLDAVERDEPDPGQHFYGGLVFPRHGEDEVCDSFARCLENEYGFRVNALDYLLKPISYSDFLESANKALEWFNLTSAPKTSQSCYQNQDDFIYIKSDYKLIQVYLKDILYIEGLKDYVKIHLETEPRPILSLMSMKSLEERLPKPQFLRVHRSFIVQSSKVKTLDRGIIVFGKERIPVSESYKPALMEFLNEHAV